MADRPFSVVMPENGTLTNGTLAPSSLSSPDSGLPVDSHGACWALVSSTVPHGFWYTFFLGLPILAFLGFLAIKVRRNFAKLLRTRSYIMATYYGFLWAVSLLNVIWFVLQVRQHKDGGTVVWNATSLIVSSLLAMLEISVVILLAQGYVATGSDALKKTLLYAGVAAGIDTFIKVLYIFALGVPLFLVNEEAHDWRKWSFWLIRSLIFVGVYLFILILPLTSLHDRLPARPSFYRYVFILFICNVLAAFGNSLIGFGTDFGFCLHGATSFYYGALYPMFIYATFLADFFLEDDFRLDDIHYSEMKDAGYFDSWE